MKWIFLILPILAYGNTQKAPENFNTASALKAVFVDFESVESTIIYDLDNEKATAQTTIKFNQNENGYILFDLIPNVLNAFIDGKKVTIGSVNAPAKETTYKMVKKETFVGDHTLIITNEITENIDFSYDHVNSAFWMSDLDDKNYLELYIPANLEYDQYPLTMNVKIISSNNADNHDIYANGDIIQNEKNDFKITYPDHFTASSIFFHLTKTGRFSEKKLIHTTPLGRQIPITIYSKYSWYISKAVTKATKVLDELEEKFGNWPHKSLVAYIAGAGGMEYSGATITSISALGHEITHSYFARGVMPMDGNSGWMDEAIASWRDDGYQTHRSPQFSSTNMSGHSQYRRYTDRRAYTEGASFMAYLNSRLEDKGGLASFLKIFHTKYTHTTIDTKLFQKEIENYSGIDFKQDFATYIFGSTKTNHEQDSKINSAIEKYHPKLSKQELKSLL